MGAIAGSLFFFFFSCASIKGEKCQIPVVPYSVVLLLLRYMIDAKFKIVDNF